MSCLHYRDRSLYIEDVNLKQIAEQYGTPCFIYSRKAIEENWRIFDLAFKNIPHRICYAVKANSNIHILKILADLNAGFDIVSIGELKRVLLAGGKPQHIIFSGVGKRIDEILQAAHLNIHCFNVESSSELLRLKAIAREFKKQIPVALRINPDINPKTHSHIITGQSDNKFGVDIEEAKLIARNLLDQNDLQLVGLTSHIGSQITELEPFTLALSKLKILSDELINMGHQIGHLNMGGGLGIRYRNENVPLIETYARHLQEQMRETHLELVLEPGRAIVANTGVLLTKIEYLKHSYQKNFAIVDAGMNDFIRPALYEAWQDILPLQQYDFPPKKYDVAGPICESADFLGKDRELSILDGDYLAIDTAGAYGFSMSSNYNSRPRAAEILVDGDTFKLIRRRESLEDLFAAEMECELESSPITE